jgi:hypothetical protein
MEIKNCKLCDAEEILLLYEAARNLQTQKNMVVWPPFEKSFIESEIKEGRQWKIVSENIIACNWVVYFEDKEIWGARDLNDAIYVHRICTNPKFRGNRYIDTIVDWAIKYAIQIGKNFVRLDTLGENKKLIEHYTSAGFIFLGMHKLTDTANLPAHYQNETNCCLFELEINSLDQKRQNLPGKIQE